MIFYTVELFRHILIITVILYYHPEDDYISGRSTLVTIMKKAHQ